MNTFFLKYYSFYSQNELDLRKTYNIRSVMAETMSHASAIGTIGTTNTVAASVGIELKQQSAPLLNTKNDFTSQASNQML